MHKIANFFIASEHNNYRPAVLSYKAFLIYGLLLLILRIILGTLPAQGAAVESGSLMNLINQERSLRNLPQLFTHSSLVNAAGQKSQDMIDRDYFDHIDPDGNYVWGRIVAAGYAPYKILGENLAVDFATSEGMVKAWIDSPTHRANLLHPDFVDQGLDARYGDYKGRYTNLTASLFGTLLHSTPRKTEVKSETPKYPTPYQNPYATPYATPYQTPESIPGPELHEQVSTGSPTTSIPTGFQKPEPDASPQPFSPFRASRIIFTFFGLFLLTILATDSVIIYKKEALVSRSHSSYHFFGFMLIVLISILIWWW